MIKNLFLNNFFFLNFYFYLFHKKIKNNLIGDSKFNIVSFITNLIKKF